MNIYSRKNLWKRILFVVAIFIIGISLWYSNILVKKIADEERQKVKLWAEAIQKKAKLVNFTDQLFDKLRSEERKKVEQYIEAIKRLAGNDDNIDFTFLTRIITDNTTVPVILTDKSGKVKTFRNLDSAIQINSPEMEFVLNEMKNQYDPLEVAIYGNQKDYVYYKDSKLFEDLQKVFDDLEKSFISEIVSNAAAVPVLYTAQNKLEVLAFGNIDSAEIYDKKRLDLLIKQMSSQNQPIEVHLQNNRTNFIFYKDSFLLTQLRYYPYVQFSVMGIFALIAYFLFSTSRREEQNRVWVGMAKETAHQLGTPLSSLMAWLEILKADNSNPDFLLELEKDILRLQTITERFSKIGSKPELHEENLAQVFIQAAEYLQNRTSKKVKFVLDNFPQNCPVKLNIPLFEWVIENLVKNAIDAMDGQGTLTFSIKEQSDMVLVDITDTGKGIPASKRKSVFEPGYTTKKRGWGLGLSLVKRIVENYHNGKIFVKWSELNKGTTFRIQLKK